MNYRCMLRFCFFALLVLSIIGLALGAHAATMPDAYIGVSELYKYCLPGGGGPAMLCEGQEAKVIGHIDAINILCKNQRMFQEIVIKDKSGATLEVLIATPNTVPVFRKIFHAQKQGEETIFVKATIVGINLPMARSCHKGIRLELRSADDVSFR
ncbi:MAG: hypothetical protein HQL09_02330 [Nitrospirae bacterium]|nr:hypothetical protein [Nitrospirota bacterium]